MIDVPLSPAAPGHDRSSVVMLDQFGRPNGVRAKHLVHTTDTSLHLAFSCHVMDERGRVLVTRRALGRPPRVQPALQRTTDVSGTLVRRACEGEAIPQLGHLLNAVADGAGAPQVHHRLENLLRVGSSSGAGLAIGAATALLHQEARR